MTQRFCLGQLDLLSSQSLDEAQRLLREIRNPPADSQVYKDNHRTLVMTWTRTDGQQIIYKEPREHYHGWFRFLRNQLRTCEAFDLFQSLERLNQLGHRAPRPLLAAEKKKFGFTVSGLVVYEHLEGCKPDTDNPAHMEAITRALLKLHSQGYTRKDPRPHNFLISSSGEALFIDCNLRKPWLFSRLRRISEFHKLYRHHPEAEAWLDEKTRKSLYYRAIKAIKTALRNARPGKKKLP